MPSDICYAKTADNSLADFANIGKRTGVLQSETT
jgi:hypothetical protein